MIDVSCVITFHKEQLLAHATLKSLGRCREYAEENDMSMELVIVFDNADPKTRQVVTEHPALRNTDKILFVDNKDPGLSRNDGIAAASGKIVAVCDGDDLYDRKYIWLCARQCMADENIVALPQYQVCFEGINTLCEKPDLQSIELYDLVAQNPFVVAVVCRRELFLKVPYQPNSCGFGYEDWHWHTEVIAHGYRQVPVEGAIYFYRSNQRRDSVFFVHTRNNCVIRASSLFDMLPDPSSAFENSNLKKNNLFNILKWKVKSGLNMLPPRLSRVTEKFLRLGGTLYLKREAVKITESSDGKQRVEFSDGTSLEADYVILTVEPSVAFEKLLNLPLPRALAKRYADPKMPRFSSLQCAFACDCAKLPFRGDFIFKLPKAEQKKLHAENLIIREFSHEKEFSPKGHNLIQSLIFCGEKTCLQFIKLRNKPVEYQQKKQEIAQSVQKCIEKKFPQLQGK